MSLYGDSTVGQLVSVLQSREDLPALAPEGPWKPELVAEIHSTGLSDLFDPLPVADPEFANCARSALLLWNDALEESHMISQSIDSVTGSYLHGIMHRREPDYGNAKYWFRRVGGHDLFPEMAAAASGRLPGMTADWDPFLFIDLCEAAADGSGRMDDKTVSIVKDVQLAEIRLLVEYCFGKAVA